MESSDPKSASHSAASSSTLICHSKTILANDLIYLFDRALRDERDERSTVAFHQFSLSQRSRVFWELYSSIYALVYEWSKTKRFVRICSDCTYGLISHSVIFHLER